MTKLIKYSDGRTVSPVVFKASNSNIVYPGTIPPKDVLSLVEAIIIDIPPTKDQVNAERDRRIDAGFEWNGHTFQSDKDSRENITGAATSAVSFIVSGGSPDEVYWQSPDTPFVWLATDNTEVQMTPEQVIDFGNTAMAHKKAHIFAARTLKDMATIPQDFTADKYWP